MYQKRLCQIYFDDVQNVHVKRASQREALHHCCRQFRLFDFAADASIGTYVCTYDFTETALRALVKILYGEMAPAGLLPGAGGQNHQARHARQQWLVEEFPRRSRRRLQWICYFKRHKKEPTPASAQLFGVSTSHFLLHLSTIQETHFVVRNSSTKELFGFCATYFSPVSGVGNIAAIIVDPARRKLSIGHSLHDRAIRALIQKKGIKRLQLGSRLPGVYIGIPKSDFNEHQVLLQWVCKTGMERVGVAHDLLYGHPRS